MFAEAALAAWSFRWGSSQKSGSAGQIELISALAACLTVCILAVQSLCPAALWKDRPSRHVEHDDQRAAQFERRDAVANEVRYRGGEALTAFYGGAQYTYPSHVRIQRPGTDLTLHNLPWEGRPFDHPIYYGRCITGRRNRSFPTWHINSCVGEAERSLRAAGQRPVSPATKSSLEWVIERCLSPLVID